MDHVAEIYETRLRRVEDQQLSFMDAHGDLSRLIHGQSRHFDEIKTRLANLEGRTANTERRLDAVEKRLDGVEKRLDTIDLRLERIDLRFDRLDGRMDELEAMTRLGFEKVNMRLERQDEAIVALQQQVGALQLQSEQTQTDMAFIKDILLRNYGATES